MTEHLTLRLRRGSRRMQYLVDQYRLAHPHEGPDVRPDLVANWAVDRGLWRPLPASPREALRRLVARSLRETYVLDPQGREVRANLPIIEEVMTQDGPKRLSRYYPIYDAPARVARASFALRRRAALADVSQIHFDFLSYNENNNLGETLDSLDFNFNVDIEEMAYPTNPEPDPDEDGEDDGEDED